MRRIRAGERWREIITALLPVMREGWADVDLLLDPFFLHLLNDADRVRWYPEATSRAQNVGDPNQHQGEPHNLLAALTECDTSDPWRNHCRDRPQAHPARRIGRLPNKFNPPGGAGGASP
ncbi:hypothetical protein JG688_00018233 [Phytophthora aleatoria]|uniref:Uncharacterized protein n=1 Tax=Phytophthora aleatoria TaxID=2496075 RepID=A0A8J5IPR1_9STRA|nr:hypothetical protein JG688_00018233 [Phytophthora aleatoria]